MYFEVYAWNDVDMQQQVFSFSSDHAAKFCRLLKAEVISLWQVCVVVSEPVPKKKSQI
jgi:hypothetical protein